MFGAQKALQVLFGQVVVDAADEHGLQGGSPGLLGATTPSHREACLSGAQASFCGSRGRSFVAISLVPDADPGSEADDEHRDRDEGYACDCHHHGAIRRCRAHPRCLGLASGRGGRRMGS